MFALLLAVALVGTGGIQAAPNPIDCGPSCDRTPITKSGSYSRHGSYKSWSSQSSYGGAASRGSSLGSTGARLEDLGETTSLDRPDSWQDRKDYVTNDGRGQMSYEAGQTVYPNGYSKFAKHSYSYNSRDNPNARLSNAEVISTAEFSQQFQNIRERIRSFMGNFALGAGSNIDANFLQDFNTKASMYNQQMNDVCNQYDVNSSAYQQMRQLQQQFERQVQERKQAIENVIEQHSSSSSYTKVESVSHVPVRQPAAPIVEYVAPREDTVAIQRATDQINQIQAEINSFWTTFSHVELSYEFSQNFKTKVDDITQQLSNLSQKPVPNEAIRRQIQNLKSTFNAYCENITNYIKAAEEDKHKKEEERLRQKQIRLEQERKSYEDQISHVQSESLRLQQELELQKSKHQQQEYQMQQQLEQERARQRQLDTEKQRLQNEEFAIEQEEIKIQQQKLESQRQQAQLLQQIQQQQQQLTQLEIEVAQKPQPVVQPARIVEHHHPEVSETSVKVEGHATYEHHIKGSSGSHQGGRYVQQQHQQPLESHVDVTAMINKLQQDLYRLQNEVNNFNGYSMRLTSSNSASLVSEANSQASNLRQRLEDLCSSSRKYQNQQILSSAEELERNFDRMFEEFKTQASSFSSSGGFSSQSAWSSSQKQSRVHAPTITDVEVEHTKTTEVEFKGRPGRRYTAGGQHQVECVESQAGQPCADQLGRRKRQAGGN